jgi:hypothetical protein
MGMKRCGASKIARSYMLILHLITTTNNVDILCSDASSSDVRFAPRLTIMYSELNFVEKSLFVRDSPSRSEIM